MEFLDTGVHRPFGALVERLTKVMAADDFRIVICGPPGSGKATAVRHAAASIGLMVRTHEDQTNHVFGSLEPFKDSILRQAMFQISDCGGVSPTILLLTGLETFDTNNMQAALDFIVNKQQVVKRVVVTANCIHKKMVSPPGQLIYHRGFSQDAVVKAMARVSGYNLLPRTGLNVCYLLLLCMFAQHFLFCYCSGLRKSSCLQKRVSNLATSERLRSLLSSMCMPGLLVNLCSLRWTQLLISTLTQFVSSTCRMTTG
jgi:hypothetical protein